ncbi:DUF6273 domain-containing protein [Schaalia cardiffensis]|uniref:DUF6273 domain-containing protein n=1 Tax=Schaalia cardiffensis TaxID=181487 RepID=UPI0023F409F6|nr:DUF6273 domain-containing protein [Schaalia cardiffensis]
MRKTRRALAATIVLALIVVGAFLIWREHRMAVSYQEALRLEQSGEDERAYEAFAALGGYAEAEEHLRAMLNANPALPYRVATKGSLVDFGSYEQDGKDSNGPEPIRWIVLDKLDGRLLLLSLDSLEARPYHPVPFAPITWQDSDLRQWMNMEFLNTAFTDLERSLIPTVEVPNAAQTKTGTTGGPATKDRVFALSETEAAIYIADPLEHELVGKALLSAKAADDALPLDEDGHADWWLRSPGTYDFTAQFIDRKGAAHVSGANVDVIYGVRPALWLDTNPAGEEQ